MKRINRKTSLAFYGNINLVRGYCSKRKTNSFIIDGFLQCCDKYVGKQFINPTNVQYMNAPKQKRKPLGSTDKQVILENQNNKCIYCGEEFGNVVMVNGKTYPAYPVWDHVIPFSMSFNNHANNYVASCQICNAIKTDKFFDSLEDASQFIMEERNKKGIGSEKNNALDRLKFDELTHK